MTAKIKSFMRRSRMPSRPHAMDDRIAGMTTNRTAMMTRKMRNATARIMPTSSWVAVVTLLCIMGCSQSNAQLPSPNFSSVHIGGFPVPTVNGATAAGHCPQFSNSSTTTPQLTDSGAPCAGAGASGITAITGDLSASGVGSVVGTLNQSVNPGAVTAPTCGDGANVCQVTTNSKGLVLSAVPVQITAGNAGITALTGDVTASGNGSVAATLAPYGVAGTFGSANTAAVVTTDTKGRVTVSTSPITPLSIGALPVDSAVATTLLQISGLQNNLTLTPSATANAPDVLSASGTDATINVQVQPKGASGLFQIGSNASSNLLSVGAGGSSVIIGTNNASGSGNLDLFIESLNNGNIWLQSGNSNVLKLANSGSGTSGLGITSGAGTVAVVPIDGSLSNVSWTLSGLGTGTVGFPSGLLAGTRPVPGFATGTFTAGDCLQVGSASTTLPTIADAGSACGSGGGGGSGTVTAGTSPQIAQYTGSSLASVSAVTMSGDAAIASGGAVTVSKIGGTAVSLAGALTTSGANTLTLTTTGPTSVTLPTSGTLVNSGVTGLSSLATVGTITSGTWNGGTIGTCSRRHWRYECRVRRRSVRFIHQRGCLLWRIGKWWGCPGRWGWQSANNRREWHHGGSRHRGETATGDRNPDCGRLCEIRR